MHAGHVRLEVWTIDGGHEVTECPRLAVEQFLTEWHTEDQAVRVPGQAIWLNPAHIVKVKVSY